VGPVAFEKLAHQHVADFRFRELKGKRLKPQQVLRVLALRRRRREHASVWHTATAMQEG
jgi:uncharacterized protein (DUF111 family)